MRRVPHRLCSRPGLAAIALAAAIAIPGVALAVVLMGDLNGDGSVDAADEALLVGLWNSTPNSGSYDPAADLNADGRIDALDLAVFGAQFGSGGGYADTVPPALFVTLNDIPDDMNDLLVVPPEGFQITLDFDSAGGSIVDPGSLTVTASEDIGPYPAGSELAPLFSATPLRASWEVPAGSDLARTSHFLTISLRDAAGNEASQVYGFAVRDFAFGAPMGNPQTIFLDFDQDRSLGPEIDFIEDLRQYGLSSANPLPGAEGLEAQIRDEAIAEIIARVHPHYGRNPDGSPGADPANITFQSTLPAGTHSRLCVGGASSQGGSYFGAASLDVNNLSEATDECSIAAQFGVFPQAIDDLWGTDAEYHAAFDPVDPDEGGIPVGEHPLDATILAPGFDPSQATAEQAARLAAVDNAIDAFAETVATGIAHETGHMLGLTAPGPAPAGLWGNNDHNSTTLGSTPQQNYLMNQGGSFSFEEVSGRGGSALPTFRPLNWAYLRDRVALDDFVFGLFPAPTLDAVDPPSISFYGGGQNRTVKFIGTNFIDHPDAMVALPRVELLPDGGGAPDPVYDVAFVSGDPSCCADCCLSGRINKFSVIQTLYDVRLINGDGQEVVLVGGLEVQ